MCVCVFNGQICVECKSACTHKCKIMCDDDGANKERMDAENNVNENLELKKNLTMSKSTNTDKQMTNQPTKLLV